VAAAREARSDSCSTSNARGRPPAGGSRPPGPPLARRGRDKWALPAKCKPRSGFERPPGVIPKPFEGATLGPQRRRAPPRRLHLHHGGCGLGRRQGAWTGCGRPGMGAHRAPELPVRRVPPHRTGSRSCEARTSCGFAPRLRHRRLQRIAGSPPVRARDGASANRVSTVLASPGSGGRRKGRSRTDGCHAAGVLLGLPAHREPAEPTAFLCLTEHRLHGLLA